MACRGTRKGRFHDRTSGFEVPFFETSRAELASGDESVSVHPQPIVRPIGPDGLSGPLVRVDPAGRFIGSLDGAVALVDLPHARWSSILAPAARRPIEAAFSAGAKAVVAQGDRS